MSSELLCLSYLRVHQGCRYLLKLETPSVPKLWETFKTPFQKISYMKWHLSSLQRTRSRAVGGSSAAGAAAALLTTCLIDLQFIIESLQQLSQMILKLQLLRNGMIAVLGRFVPVSHTFIPCFHRLLCIAIDRKPPKALQLQKIPFSQRKCV